VEGVAELDVSERALTGAQGLAEEEAETGFTHHHHTHIQNKKTFS